jgi:ADP-heptose:LPS heptosyltransferase
MSTFQWQTDIQPNQVFKKVTNTQLRLMGLPINIETRVKDLKELRENPPNIIIAKAVKTLRFVQNYFEEQQLTKNINYVMGLGVFQQLHRSSSTGSRKFLKPSSLKFKNFYKPFRGQDLTDKTLLIFRTGGIGDLLFIQPNLFYLKEKYPTCVIKFACGPQYRSMVETWSCVDEVLELPFSLRHLQESDYHALFEGVIERCKLAESINAYNLFSEWLGLNLSDDLLIPKQSAKSDLVDFCLKKLSEWNIEPYSFVLMQLRASSPVRTPSPDFWMILINELTKKGYDIILTDSPRQADHVDQFIRRVKDPNKVFNFCKYSQSLDYSIALTSLCALTLATDSAMNHIAASLSRPCVGIYGPFPGYIRLKTYPKAAWVDAKRNCAPCFIHSQVPCKESLDGFSPCYNSLDLEDIMEKIDSVRER